MTVVELPPAEKADARDELIRKFVHDPVLAHETLFPERHTNDTPLFHEQMIADWHDVRTRQLCHIAFRGSAKSTRAEEATAIMAIHRVFTNGLILCANLEPLGIQRLRAIKRMFERNQNILQIYGDLKGKPWADDVIELKNGVLLRAMGRGQSIRGTKGDIERPDFLMFDDVEDVEMMKNPEARDKIQRWVLGEVIPAGTPNVLVRMIANDLDPECLAVRLKKAKTWKVRVYPIETKDIETGARTAQWPARYPLDWIEKKRTEMYALGRGREFESDYMCSSTSPEDKPFLPEQIRVQNMARTWQATYCMYDPARKTGPDAATTGFACWSWVGDQLIVWDSWGRKLMPDEIVNSMFETAAKYDPVHIGFEETGLNEWALQPIRLEMLKRGVMLPLRPVNAPQNKFGFIRGLQPWFKARQCIFAQALPDLASQLISFPTGYIDAPNALAYALHPKFKSGLVMYEDFTTANIAESIAPNPSQPTFLCLNADKAVTTGVLVQAWNGLIRVIADFVREGEPALVVREILRDAAVECFDYRVVVPPRQFDIFDNTGVVQAAKAFPKEVQAGAPPDAGQMEIRAHIKQEVRGMKALLVSTKARWTLNALAGGYARPMMKGAVLAETAEEGPYKTLMEGIESFLALRGAGSDDAAREVRYATTAGGRRYMSALPQIGGGGDEVKDATHQTLGPSQGRLLPPRRSI